MKARQFKVALSAMRNKTGIKDAHGSTRLLCTGWYSPAHVKSIESHQFRALLSSSKAVLTKCVDLENEIRGLSGEMDNPGHISCAGDPEVRCTLYLAANSMMTRSSRWSPLKVWGTRLAKQRGHKRAVVAASRKPAGMLHRMWLDDTTYRWGTEGTP